MLRGAQAIRGWGAGHRSDICHRNRNLKELLAILCSGSELARITIGPDTGSRRACLRHTGLCRGISRRPRTWTGKASTKARGQVSTVNNLEAGPAVNTARRRHKALWQLGETRATGRVRGPFKEEPSGSPCHGSPVGAWGAHVDHLGLERARRVPWNRTPPSTECGEDPHSSADLLN